MAVNAPSRNVQELSFTIGTRTRQEELQNVKRTIDFLGMEAGNADLHAFRRNISSPKSIPGMQACIA